MIIIITSIILSGLFTYSLVKPKRKITIDFTSESIYGWYNSEILVNKRFYSTDTITRINQIKQEVSIELDKKIQIYKEVNK